MHAQILPGQFLSEQPLFIGYVDPQNQNLVHVLDVEKMQYMPMPCIQSSHNENSFDLKNDDCTNALKKTCGLYADPLKQILQAKDQLITRGYDQQDPLSVFRVGLSMMERVAVVASGSSNPASALEY